MTLGSEQTVKSKFGLPSLTLLVIASMVGAGVFTTSGFTLAVVGTPFRVMLCWTIGSAIACCGAVAYGHLARIIPQSGGEYLYLSRHVHPFAGFLAGWVSLVAGFSGAIATAAVAFEAYAVPTEIRPQWLYPDVVAICVVLSCGLAHGLRQSWGTSIQNGVVVIKLLCLAAFVLLALEKMPENIGRLARTVDNPQGMELWTAIATSVVWISLSYAGFNAAIYVASESKEAVRNVPRALLFGTIGVTVLYLILNLIFVTSADSKSLEWQEDVAAIAAGSIGGRNLEGLVRAAISLGLLSSVSGMIMSGPRVYSKMADDGVFPKSLRAASQGIPKSVGLQTLIAVGLILVQRVLVTQGLSQNSLLGLLKFLGTTLSITSACCAATIFLPSARRAAEGLSVPVAVAAGLYVTATLTAVILLIMSHEVEGQPRGLWHLTGATVTFASGAAAYLIFRRRHLHESDA